MKKFLHVFFVLSFLLIMTDSCSNKQLAIEENAYLDSLVNIVLLQSSSATSVISVVPEKLFYDPGKTVTFSGKIIDSEGKVIPEVQAEIDNPLQMTSVLSPKTNKEGRFTYTVTLPSKAGIYAFGFSYNASKSYAIISVTPQSGLKLTNTQHKINLGVSSSYNVTDLATLIKMSGSSGFPKANQEQLINAAKQISLFMAGERSGSILEYVPNPATDVVTLAAVACAGETWTGVGTNPYSALYNLVLAPGVVSTITGPVTSAIDMTSMSVIDKAFWTDAVKTGKCTIGILSLDPSTVSADVSKIGTGWTCGSAAVTVAGNNNISIVAAPTTSSVSQNVVGIALIKKNTSPTKPTNPNPAGGATSVSLEPTLTWTSSDPDGDAIKYNIYFGESTSAPLKVSGKSEASYKPGTLIANKKYYWKIVALDGKGGEGSGEWWSFTTGN